MKKFNYYYIILSICIVIIIVVLPAFTQTYLQAVIGLACLVTGYFLILLPLLCGKHATSSTPVRDQKTPPPVEIQVETTMAKDIRENSVVEQTQIASQTEKSEEVEEIAFLEEADLDEEAPQPINGRLIEKIENIVKKIADELAEETDQAADEQTIVDCLEKMKKITDFVQQNTQKTFAISGDLSKTAKEAFALAGQVQNGITDILKTLKDLRTDTDRLNVGSQEISGILDIMSDIFGKIHVLSINASIVSSRAGEHGREFKVVAQEIRKLAEDTEKSLGDIGGLVEEIQQDIHKVSNDTTSIEKETKKESDSLNKVADSLKGVLLAIEIINSVSRASAEKIKGHSEISDRAARELASGTRHTPVQTIAIHDLIEELESIKQI